MDRQPTKSQLQQQQQQQQLSSRADQVKNIKNKLTAYLTAKFPETYAATSGYSDTELTEIVNRVIVTSGNNQQQLRTNINNLLSILERKMRERMYSENRINRTVNTNQYSMDPLAEIPRDKYVNDNFNPIKPLSSSDTGKESGKQASSGDRLDPAENKDYSKAKFEEDTEKQLDMFVPEERPFNYNIIIDSKDRDLTKYPSASHFVIDFSPPSYSGPSGSINSGYVNRAFGNIISCDLLEFSLFDTSDRSDSSDSIAGGVKIPYLILELVELGSNYQGTNDVISKAFAVLTTYETQLGYKHYAVNSDNSYHTITKIYNPRINLNKLTVNVKLPDGTPYNFGAVEESDDSRPSLVKLSFRITCLQKNLATTFYAKAVY